MNKRSKFLLYPTLCLCLAIGLSSCDDDEAPPRPIVSFSGTGQTVNEGAGTISVSIVLDRAYNKDVNIEYSVGGTASDQDQVGTAAADFQINGTHGVVNIPANSTSGEIEIQIINDNLYEEDETVILRITDTNTADIEIGDPSEYSITITSDDAQLVASFASTTMTISEDDEFGELIQVVVELDQPAPNDVVITYTVDGTAIDSLTGNANEIPPMYYDYHVHGKLGELTIPAGETSGSIELLVYTDLLFEDDETIELTLTASGAVAVGENATTTITLLQQDGKAIVLVWPTEAKDQQVDMDLFLWAGENAENLNVVALSATAGIEPQLEVVFLPKILTDDMDDLTFGISCNYYSGSADPLQFEVHYADFVDGQAEAPADRDIFAGTYTQANVSEWSFPNNPPAVVQTFRVVSGAFTDFSDIVIPASGSRTRPVTAPPFVRRYNGFYQRMIR